MGSVRRFRLFEIMQQTDKIDLSVVFNWLDKVDCKYLCVLHDKDNKNNIHYHIMINFADAHTIDDVSKQCDVAPQYIERGKTNFNNMCGYAFHLTDNCASDGKYIYDRSAVIKSRDVDIDKVFNDDVKIKAEKQHDEDIKNLLLDYGELKKTKRDVIDIMTSKDYAKYSKLYKSMQDYRLLKIRDREMQVIYITGVSGSGKSTLAKYLARVNNYDVFISGSGKDVLDGYDKEECIILDDLRDDVFSKAELFKLTDNYMNSSVKSRYNNKDISNCKLMVITSVKEPHNLYNWLDDVQESFYQFARRINFTYLKIDSKDIASIEYSKDVLSHISRNNYAFLKNCRVDIQPYDINDVFTVMGIVKAIDDNNSALKNLMNKAFEEIKRQEENKQLRIDDFIKDNDSK